MQSNHIRNPSKSAGLNANQRKKLLFQWYKCKDDCSLEDFFLRKSITSDLGHRKESELSHFLKAANDLDLAALRRLRHDIIDAKVDEVVRSKINKYVEQAFVASQSHSHSQQASQKNALVDTSKEANSNTELIRELALGWFTSENMMSIHNYMKSRGEMRLTATVNDVVQRAGIQSLRKESQNHRDEIALASEKIDSVLLRTQVRRKTKARSITRGKKKKVKRSSDKKMTNEENVDEWMDWNICSDEL